MRKPKTKREQITGLVEKKKIIGHDPITGKPIRKSFYGKGRRAEEQIDEKYRQYLASQDAIAESKETLAAYGAYWIEKFKQPVVSDLTYKNTYEAAMKIITNYFGDAQLSRIRTSDVQAFFIANRHRNKWMVDKLHYILKDIFAAAAHDGLIRQTPFVNIVKYSKDPGERLAYDKQAYFDCLAYAKIHPLGIGPFVVLKTGLRRGELCALQWNDIDLDRQIVNMRRAVTYDQYGRLMYNEGKTAKAKRQIPIDRETADYLAAYPRISPCVVGTAPKYVWRDPKNYNRRDYHSFQDDFVAKTGHIPLRLHELRHTYGTMLYKFHTPLEAIAKTMGHANLEITRKIYVHDDVEDVRERIVFPSDNYDKFTN
jgi:integrase